MLTAFAVPAAFAILIWWFATGAILFLDGLPRSTFRLSLSAAAVLGLWAVYEVRRSAADPTVDGAYAAFLAAIMIWGWLEMSFLMGFITGPRRHACREHCGGWAHFRHATEAIIYNELATLAAAAGLFLVTRGALNRVALWTFLVLWGMRLSAKLNLFFGVPNLGEQFLPAHLQYLKSFFRRRALNAWFPLSVSISAGAAVALLRGYARAGDAFHATGYALTGSLLLLGLIEHAFMVIPLPSEKLWTWAMRPATRPATRRDPPRPCLPPVGPP